MTTMTETGERTDLLQTLGKHRFFLRHTVNGLTDEQAASRPTVSELSLGGLIKHVAATEKAWLEFALGDPSAMAGTGQNRADEFRMLPGETLAQLLDEEVRPADR